MFVQIGQNGCREHIDPSQQVVRRDHLAEAKLVKALSLISVLPPHHSRISCRFLSRNHCSLGSSTPFSTASVKLRSAQHEQMFSALLLRTDIGSRSKILRGSDGTEFCLPLRQLLTWRLTHTAIDCEFKGDRAIIDSARE